MHVLHVYCSIPSQLICRLHELHDYCRCVILHCRWLVVVVGPKWFTPPSTRRVLPAPLALSGHPSRRRKTTTVKMPPTCAPRELPIEHPLCVCTLAQLNTLCVHTSCIMSLPVSGTHYQYMQCYVVIIMKSSPHLLSSYYTCVQLA